MKYRHLSTLFLGVGLLLSSCTAPIKLTSLTFDGDYQIEFFLNEEFNHEGLEVYANYSNNTQKEVFEYTVSDPDMTVAGSQKVTVTYKEKSVTVSNFYMILVQDGTEEECEQEKSDALIEIRSAFNELEAVDYSSDRWQQIVDKLNEATKLINAAKNKATVEQIKEETLNFFRSVPTQEEIRRGTWFDYGSPEGKYEFDKDSSGNIQIKYDGYPGDWVYVGTKTNLNTDITQNNLLTLKFRNDSTERIKVVLQLTDSSGTYKLDSHTVSVSANEVKTITHKYEQNVTNLYFFVDSTEVHNRKGIVTILETTLSLEGESFDDTPKTVQINKSATKEDNSETKYTLTEEDYPGMIDRVLFTVYVNYNGNGYDARYYGIQIKAGNNKYAGADFIQEKDATNPELDNGRYLTINLEIAENKALVAGDEVNLIIAWNATNLTFDVLSYTFYYGGFKEAQSETRDINSPIYVNGKSSTEEGEHLSATVNFADFTKKGLIKRIDIKFTSINEKSYANSKIYLDGFTFTNYSSNNNLLDIGSIMAKSSSEEVSGTLSVYPLNKVDLNNGGSFNIDCWYTSATYIRVDQVTIYTY